MRKLSDIYNSSVSNIPVSEGGNDTSHCTSARQERIDAMKHEKIEQIGSHRKQCRGMYDLLQEYVRAGIRRCLDGKEAEPGQVAATCLREGVSYMMDFIPENSSSQKITEIDFNRIEGPGRAQIRPSPLPGCRKMPDPSGDPPGSPGWCG